MKNTGLIKFILAMLMLLVVQSSNVLAQTSPEIERLAAEIAKNPDNDFLYLQRAILYEKRSRITEKKELQNSSGYQKKAYDDATMALKLNPLNFRALGFRGTFTFVGHSYLSAEEDLIKAAEMESKSNIVAEVFLKDVGNAEMMVVKGDAVNQVGVDTLAQANAIAKKSKRSNVIIFDKQKKKYFVYTCILSYYSSFNARQAETTDHSGLDQLDIFSDFGDEFKPIPFEFASLKLNLERHLMLFKDPWDRYNAWSEVIDIVDAKGLSVVSSSRFFQPGEIGWKQLIDGEVTAQRYPEALEIYLHLEKINATNKDQESVKRIRKDNLAKLYFALATLRPFVEKEMKKWKYNEADKTAVRGTNPK